MTRVDYIVVGCGLAGIAFCEQLRMHKNSFIVIDDNSQQSSKVAGGIYNPVVLKRFTSAWKAEQLIDAVPKFYNALEAYLNKKLNFKMPVYRLFTSVEEQNNWFTASDQPVLSKFISPKINNIDNQHIQADFGMGEVLETGRIDTKQLVNLYTVKLRSEKRLIQQAFEFEHLKIGDRLLNYKDIEATYIVFAEGFGLKRNPYFNYLPLVGSKGEYLMINAPELKLDIVLKASIFIIPLGDDLYLAGATYNNEDKSLTPTVIKKQELLIKLQKIISCDFKIVDHLSGIRPTVKDRRPLVGRHPKFKNLAILNGLGTRGVMIAPYAAEQLYNTIEKELTLEAEIDIRRFNHLFVS